MMAVARITSPNRQRGPKCWYIAAPTAANGLLLIAVRGIKAWQDAVDDGVDGDGYGLVEATMAGRSPRPRINFADANPTRRTAWRSLRSAQRVPQPLKRRNFRGKKLRNLKISRRGLSLAGYRYKSSALTCLYFLLILSFMIGTEDHFRRTLGPGGARLLVEVIAGSVTGAAGIAAENGFTEARTTPTVAYDLAKTALDTEFEDVPGVRSVCRNGQNFWIFDDTYALRVKKLDRQYRPANHESVQQSAISAQQLLDGAMVELIHVTAGARLSTTTGLAEDFVVVKHRPGHTNNLHFEWVVDLEELASGQMSPVAPILPIEPAATVAPAAIVRRSQKEKEVGGASE